MDGSEKSINQEVLAQLVEKYKPCTKQGKVADYIPELAYANPHALGIAAAFPDGAIIAAGDARARFTLQSISKVIALMAALNECGPERVFSKVGMEPSVDPFNSIVKLETVDHKKPLNPMINAGAIVICSLLSAGGSVDARLQRLCDAIGRITGREDVGINEKVFESERQTGDRNRALAYFMKSTGVIDPDVDIEETLELYFKACAIEVDCIDLAKISLFIALKGMSPGVVDGDAVPALSIISPEIAQIVTTIMITSGMYNRSGEFFLKVGLPAKSGVSGGVAALVPGRCGFGLFGPAIDDAGNSVASVHMLQELSGAYGLHLLSR